MESNIPSASLKDPLGPLQALRLAEAQLDQKGARAAQVDGRDGREAAQHAVDAGVDALPVVAAVGGPDERVGRGHVAAVGGRTAAPALGGTAGLGAAGGGRRGHGGQRRSEGRRRGAGWARSRAPTRSEATGPGVAEAREVVGHAGGEQGSSFRAQLLSSHSLSHTHTHRLCLFSCRPQQWLSFRPSLLCHWPPVSSNLSGSEAPPGTAARLPAPVLHE